MLRTLFFNSIVSALQITIGLVTYFFYDSNVWSVALMVAIMTTILIFITTNEDERSILISAACAAFAVSAVAGAAVLVASATEPSFGRIAAIGTLVVFTIGCIVAIVAGICFMVDENIEDGAREPWSILIMVRIPAGIGTVVSGTVLFTRWLHGLIMEDKYPMT